MTDVRNDGRVDEAMRQSDDDHATDRATRAQATFHRRSHEPDQHQTDPAEHGAPEQDAFGVAGSVDQPRDISARRHHAESIQHDDLANILLTIAILPEE